MKQGWQRWVRAVALCGMLGAGCGGVEDEPAVHAQQEEVRTGILAQCPVTACDQDGDCYRRPSCGGNDCADHLPNVHPGADGCHDCSDNDGDGWIDESDECQGNDGKCIPVYACGY